MHQPSDPRVDHIGLGDPGQQSSLHPEAGPYPESPAPPVIILAKSSHPQGPPHFQVPDPASGAGEPPEPRPRPHPHTSFSLAEKSPTPRYDFRQRKREKSRAIHVPDEPHPEPHPAPPVIILPKKRPASSSPNPTSPKTPDSLTSPPTDAKTLQKHKMGSNSSKVTKIAPVHGKLQASQERQDKEEMKEPTNYYTHRSKSMRRKAGKGTSAAAAGGSGSAGAGVV